MPQMVLSQNGGNSRSSTYHLQSLHRTTSTASTVAAKSNFTSALSHVKDAAPNSDLSSSLLQLRNDAYSLSYSWRNDAFSASASISRIAFSPFAVVAESIVPITVWSVPNVAPTNANFKRHMSAVFAMYNRRFTFAVHMSDEICIAFFDGFPNRAMFSVHIMDCPMRPRLARPFMNTISTRFFLHVLFILFHRFSQNLRFLSPFSASCAFLPFSVARTELLDVARFRSFRQRHPVQRRFIAVCIKRTVNICVPKRFSFIDIPQESNRHISVKQH